MRHGGGLPFTAALMCNYTTSTNPVRLSGSRTLSRISGKRDRLDRTEILRHNPARCHSRSCCADGRILWVCNACSFLFPPLQWQRLERHLWLKALLSRGILLAMILSRRVVSDVVSPP